MERKKLTPRKIGKLLGKRVKGEEINLDADSESEWDLSAESEAFDSEKDPDYDPNNDDFDEPKRKCFKLFPKTTLNYSDNSDSDDEPALYKCRSRLFEKNIERQLEIGVDATCSGSKTTNSIDASDIVNTETQYINDIVIREEVVETSPAKPMTRDISSEKQNRVSLKRKLNKIKSMAPTKGSANIMNDTNVILDESSMVENEQDNEDNLTSKSTTKRKKNSKSNKYKITVLGKEIDIEWSDWEGRQETFTFNGKEWTSN